MQKPRRPRKGAPFGLKVSQQRVEPNGSGSRFDILHEEAGDGDQNGGGVEDLSRAVVVHQPLVDKEQHAVTNLAAKNKGKGSMGCDKGDGKPEASGFNAGIVVASRVSS